MMSVSSPGLAIASPLPDPRLAASQCIAMHRSGGTTARRPSARLEEALLEPKSGGSPFPCDQGLRSSASGTFGDSGDLGEPGIQTVTILIYFDIHL